MRICRSALRVAAGHPVYLVVYVVFLSLVGVFIVRGTAAPAAQAASPAALRADLVVVDRDGSDASRALAEYLAREHTVLDVPDEAFALQDALATSAADAVIVVPEGFGAACLDAARAGGGLPELRIAYGASTQEAALAEQEARRWVSLLGAAAVLEPDASMADAARLASEAGGQRAATEVLAAPASAGGTASLQAYLNFSTYTLTCSVVVCAGLVLSTMGERRLRSRMLASPVHPRRASAQVLSACAVLTAAVWAFTCAVGLAASGVAGSSAPPAHVALALAAFLVFAAVPLALAFLLAQLGLREEGLNALGNIGGMLMSFLGGAWVPLSMLGEPVRTLSRFSPTSWTADAVGALLSAPSLTAELLGRVAVDVGVTALFAIAIASVAFALARNAPAAAAS